MAETSETKFSIQIRNVRAIQEATVDLDAISVLCGENGSGKTTISKLIYGHLYTSIHFDELVEAAYRARFRLLRDFLSQILQVMAKSGIPLENLTTVRDAFAFARQFTNIDTLHLFVENELLPKIQNAEIVDKQINKVELSRLYNLYRDKFSKNKDDFASLTDLLSDLNTEIIETINKIQRQKEKRTKTFYDLQVSSYFGELVKDWNFNFFEYGVPLINKSDNVVTTQRSFNEVVYIGNPTVFDAEQMHTEFTSPISLGEKLFVAKKKPYAETISRLFSEVLHGDIEISDDVFSKIFMYTNRDGTKITLSQAADGVKCFAVLEVLFKNGYLNADTLLIIDEPEVHLHPKWIVDYARVIVQMNKLLHCTVLLASHSPDMISALRYISKKESVSTQFYLGSKVSDEHFGTYRFKNTGSDIEPIFESFNIALERISQYGSME